MQGEVIDFTTMRLGMVTRKWTYRDKQTGKQKIGCQKIMKCPQCGRKCEGSKNGNSFTHKGRVVEDIPGFPVFMIDDHCSLPKESKK